MAQNITLLGASYSNVPAVDLPKTGGGTASFTDVTGTTAIASDVAEGKYFFTASGVLTLGTASGGDAVVWQGSDGYVYFSDTVPPPYEISMDSNGYVVIDIPATGVDVPVFTVDYSGSTTVITCNKTWAECYNLLDLDSNTAGVVVSATYGEQFAAGITSATSTYICYSVMTGMDVLYDIMYYSNGTITEVIPSSIAKKLIPKTITQNGHYSPNDDYADGYSSVDVGVFPNTHKVEIGYNATGVAGQLCVRYQNVDHYEYGDVFYVADGDPITEIATYGVTKYIYENQRFVAGGVEQKVPSYSYNVDRDLIIQISDYSTLYINETANESTNRLVNVLGGDANNCYVEYYGVKYYTTSLYSNSCYFYGSEFSYANIYFKGSVYLNNNLVSESATYTYYSFEIPFGEASIRMEYNANGSTIHIHTPVFPYDDLPITQNGTYNVYNYASVTVNVPSGGGLEYETGTWIPTTDVSTGSIPFTNSHTTAPFYYAVVDAKDSYDNTTQTNIGVIFTDWSQALGCSFYSTSTYIYEATANTMYRGTGTNLTTSNYWFTSDTGRTNWVSNVELKPQTNSTSRYWRAGRTYKWIAVWAPTT